MEPITITIIAGAASFAVGAIGSWFFNRPTTIENSHRTTETAVTNTIEIQKEKQPDTLMIIIVIALIFLGLLRMLEFVYFLYKRHYVNLKKRFTSNRNVNGIATNVESV